MKWKKFSALKSFLLELVTKKKVKNKKPPLKAFFLKLAIYSVLVVSYFLLVLHLLSGWLKELFDQSKPIYAVVALALMVTQGVVLEIVAVVVFKLVKSTID